MALLPNEIRQTLPGNGAATLAELEGECWLEADAAALATIQHPSLARRGLPLAAGVPRAHRCPRAGTPNARIAPVRGGHLIDPAAPEVIAFIKKVLAGK